MLDEHFVAGAKPAIGGCGQAEPVWLEQVRYHDFQRGPAVVNSQRAGGGAVDGFGREEARVLTVLEGIRSCNRRRFAWPSERR